MINIFIDNNAWDIFFNAKIDLQKELPNNTFQLYMTSEAEFEIHGMPKEIRDYAESFIKTGVIKTDSYFGFCDDSLPADEQRVGGFGDLFNPDVGGRFITFEESTFIDSESTCIGPQKRPTGLYKNEADVSLAARALHNIVLTCDGKKALKRVKEIHNGLIIDLKKFQTDASLGDFIKQELAILGETND